MPQTPKRPSEEPHRTGSEKKLVQTKLSFAPKSAPRFVPRPISPSSSLSSSVSSSPSSSRFFSNSAPSNSSNYRRPGPAGRGLFKNRQWVREDSAGSSSLLGLSLSDKDKRGVRGLDGEEETPRKPKPFGARYNEERVAVAKETIELIPKVLEQVPAGKQKSDLYCDPRIRLDSSKCPGYTVPDGDAEAGKKGCRIRVVNADTFDTAIGMGRVASDTKGIVLLNMANARHPGGGWLRGTMAQEEELCYRSTLSHTLNKSYYPLPEMSGIYSPSVVVFRSSFNTGHIIYPTGKPFATLSTISIAALRDPPLTDSTPPDFKFAADKAVTLEKIRMLLRIAALEGHRRLVLGALGCGAFNNPKEKVVECFLQVFREPEFSGGWWRDVVFAVLETDNNEKRKGANGDGNFGIFFRGLNGMIV